MAVRERGVIAGEASGAAAGMLAPLAETQEEDDPLLHLCLAGLEYYQQVAQELPVETGMEIGLAQVPLLRPALNEHDVSWLYKQWQWQKNVLSGLEWLDSSTVCRLESLITPSVMGALFSPYEYNVNAQLVTLAYARGAVLGGASIFTGCSVKGFLCQKERVIGVISDQGPFQAEHVVLATGAWAASLFGAMNVPLVFPVKGQMMALHGGYTHTLRHTIYAHQQGYLVPKSDGMIYVGATSENTFFDKGVTVAGLSSLFSTVMTLAPSLADARFERAWAGIRPGSGDGLPLLGAVQAIPGLWMACGHFRNGILLGPLTGYLLSALLNETLLPFDLDLAPFSPDRFNLSMAALKTGSV